jgi:hypothetical protein
MSFKESLENNAAWVASGIAIAGFVAGFSAYKVVMPDVTKTLDPSSLQWKEAATQAGWILQSSCPAYPVSANITSPGNGSVVGTLIYKTDTTIKTDLVIQSSRPIPRGSSVGYIINKDGNTNFYILFPYFKTSDDRTIFREENFVKAPFVIESGATINMWAAIVDNDQKFGSVYASIEQIKTSGSDVVISPKVSVKVE